MVPTFALLFGLAGAPPPPPSPPKPVPLIVDVSAPAPSLPALSPGFERRRLRGRVDRADSLLVMKEKRTDGPATWEDDVHVVAGPALQPLVDAGSRGHWVLDGVSGRRRWFPVVIDTAADRTIVAPELARHLGIELRDGPLLTDATGETTSTWQGTLPSFRVGQTTFTNVSVLVPMRVLRPDLFLLGRDALRHVDLLVDGVAGGIAFLPAGTPLSSVGDAAEADVVALDIDGASGRWQVAATAPGRGGRFVPFTLDVDTGSPLTSIPTLVGLEGGLPTDVSRTATLKGAAGVAVEKRGRFALRPLAIGMLEVGDVNALEASTEHGLLGTDVLARGRILFSPARRAMVVFPTTARSGSRLDHEGRALIVELLPGGEIAVDARRAPVRFLLRPHDRLSGAWRGGAVDVTIVKQGKHRLQTGLDFSDGCAQAGRTLAEQKTCAANQNWSIRVLPADRPCDGVCMVLLGDWPPSSSPAPPIR